MKNVKITKAVIPAAGFGTRFLPATKAVPKEMLPIIDKPTIQYIIEEASASGITDVLLIVSRGKDAVINHFDKSYELESVLERDGKEELLALCREASSVANIQFVRQAEQKGLGHAVLCAESFAAGEPFAVLLGDDLIVNDKKPCLAQLLDVYERTGSAVLGVQRVGFDNVSKYGIVSGEKLSDRLYRASGMIEKPSREEAKTDIAALGRYVLTPEIFGFLKRTGKGAGGEIQLTDAIVKLMDVQSVYAYDFEGTRYDIGDKLGYLRATVDFALKREDLKDEFSAYLRGLEL